jgi:UrcA family protein
MLKANPALVAAAALTAAVALVVPTVSQAAQLDSVTVSYADLNLASAVGADRLQQRISFAARVVCGYEDSRQYDLVVATNACRSGAIEGAQPAFEAAIAAARHPSVTVGAAATSLVVRAAK